MANMKKLETLVKSFDTTTNEMLAEIIGNENVDIPNLTDKEKLSVLVFSEMSKALQTKDHHLVLDCNYASSKKHSHEDAGEDEWLVTYYRLVSNNNPNSTMIQIKVTTADVKNSKVAFKLHTSCAKANRAQFEAMEDELKFKVKYDKKTNRARTSTRMNVQYDELVDVVKAVCAVLANTTAEHEAEKKAQAEKAAAEKKAQAEAKAKEKAEAKAEAKKNAPKKKAQPKKKEAKPVAEEPKTDEPVNAEPTDADEK